MGFVRSFDIAKIGKLSGDNAELFARLKADVLRGDVFPAIRKGELYFYYKGGCLYKLGRSSFMRDIAYDRYSAGTAGLLPYEKAKKQIENKFSKEDGKVKERQLLDRLYKHTFCESSKTCTVVLDIEVRLNGTTFGNKKCDMVLLNTQTSEIMFVEGKVFSDARVNNTIGNRPEVIEQVTFYTAAINEQAGTIVAQYGEHIEIVNELFDTAYNPSVKLIPKAKLLVFDVPKTLTINGQYSIDEINARLGSGNVALFNVGENPSIDEIWRTLCK